jgi:uncharacterized membrane protein
MHSPGRALALAVVLLAALPAASALHTPDPGLTYVLEGAAPAALRTGPDPGSGVSTALPAGTRGIRVTGRQARGPSGDLWEILPAAGGDRPLWVEAGRLSPGEADAGVPPLQCAGTEPFWGLRLEGGQARMSRTGQRDMDLRLGPRRSAVGDPRAFVQSLAGPGGSAGQVAVIRRPEGCSDGMSDLLAPYQAVATTPSGEILSGCCWRAGR